MKQLLILSSLAVAATTALAAPEDAMNKAGCMACHAKDKKILGPAFKDVAAKYKGDKDAVTKLTEKVRKGGSGVWGPIPMPANGPEKINDADLKAAVEWVLKS
ncbi:c-type cytochrome [Aquabacterium sp.]|uniref:c-type cytochrome n=1 Tax=Aquabacterium sp. TaxID=1872578 RepID=UPI0035B3BC3A